MSFRKAQNKRVIPNSIKERNFRARAIRHADLFSSNLAPFYFAGHHAKRYARKKYKLNERGFVALTFTSYCNSAGIDIDTLFLAAEFLNLGDRNVYYAFEDAVNAGCLVKQENGVYLVTDKGRGAIKSITRQFSKLVTNLEQRLGDFKKGF